MKMKKATKRNSANNFQKQTIQRQGYSSDNKKAIWRFDMIDRSGKFAFDVSNSNFPHQIIVEKLISYSSMTWGEIKRQTHDNGKSKHHIISVDSMCNEAVSRLVKRELEEYSDSIFSFALTNKLRVIGIKDEEHFHVLWYDPEHEICPSKKKNT